MRLRLICFGRCTLVWVDLAMNMFACLIVVEIMLPALVFHASLVRVVSSFYVRLYSLVSLLNLLESVYVQISLLVCWFRKCFMLGCRLLVLYIFSLC